MILTTLAFALSIKAVPYSWRNVQIVGGGFVSGIVTHPTARGLVYCRTDIGGAYRWDVKSKRWVPLQDWITRPDWNQYGVESVAVDPSHPTRVFLATGTYTFDGVSNGAILRSADLGKTWKRTDLPFRNGGNMDGRGIGERLMVDPSNGNRIYFGTRADGLWRSDDAGATWRQDASFPVKKSTDGNGIGWISFDPRPPFRGKRIIVGVASGESPLYETVDGGKTWRTMPSQPQGLIPHHGSIDRAGDLFVTYGNGAGPNGVTAGAVWRRPASGAWTEITPIKTGPGEAFGYAGLSLDAQVPGTLVVSTLDRWGRDTLFRTRDSGRSWVSIAPKAGMDPSGSPFVKYDHPAADFGHWINDVEIDPFNSDRVWYGTGATIWETSNFTRADRNEPTRWKIGAAGIEETAVIDLISPPVGPHVISGLGDIGGFSHFDLDTSPPKGVMINPYLSNVDDLDYAGQRPEWILRVGRTNGPLHGGISRDSGRTWRPLASDPPNGKGSGTAAISADGKTVVWSPNGPNRPYFTGDMGLTWTESKGGEPGQIVSDKVEPNTFYLLTNGTLKVSRDGGRTFTGACTGLPKRTGRLVAAYHAAGQLWLPTPEGLYRSFDFGQLFSRVTSRNETEDLEQAEQVSLGKAAPGSSHPTLFTIGSVRNEVGVFRSLDEGAHWQRINDRSTGFGTMSNIEGDPKVFGRVYVGTNGRGVLVADPRRS